MSVSQKEKQSTTPAFEDMPPPTETPSLFQPGDVIELGDITEFRSFEDLVAQAIDPSMSPLQTERWQTRTNIRDLLRPPHFNGSMTNIALKTMAEPYERFLDARERGWEFDRGVVNHKRESELSLSAASNALGFTFLADARSSGRGTVGQIQAELWYLPSPVRLTRRNAIIDSDVTGVTIQRVLTRPRLESKDFIELRDDSQRIARVALQQALVRTRPAGFHN